jgi:capsular polysaccharide biosynthesis protein/MinD-like ATPase involved in chromosome partitioning or flagellar assembly
MIEQRRVNEPVPRLRAIEPPQEQPVEVRRYVNALRGSWLMIAAIVIPLTAVVLGLSLSLPKTYSATATMLLDESPDITASADAARQLATIQTLLTTKNVLQRAARELPGESAQTLAGKVSATVDPNANIIRIHASAEGPRAASRIANAVASVFMTRQRSFELRRIEAARARLLEALARLRGTPGSRAERVLIRERLSELSVNEANAGSELQLADAARPSATPVSPRPLRNAAFALVAALFIAVIAALGRERIAPRISGPRELAQVTGLPILTQVPQATRRRLGGASPVERESYESLAAVVRSQLPTRRQHTILVTSGFGDEGKEGVAAGLGLALARAGERTLLVDADLRRPTLERLLGMEPALGLAEILTSAQRGDEDAAADVIMEPPASASRRESGSLSVLGTGEASAGVVASGDALGVLFRELSKSAFTYVVIAGPPLLGPSDCRVWVQRVEAVLVASRPERLAPTEAVEIRERLDSIGANALGHVVMGRSRGS